VIGFCLSADAACDPVRLNSCQTDFQTLTGIDLRLNWREVRRRVEDSYGGANDTNYRKVCRGFSEFGMCMRENYYQCLNVPYLVQNVSDTLQDAYQTLAIYLQQHFVCGAGFNVFLKNEACFLNIWGTMRQRLDFCREDYDQLVINNLGNQNGAFCFFGNQMRDCFENVFNTGCQGSIDALWWICEYSRVDVITQFPFCSTAGNRCTLPITGGVIGK